LSNAKADRSLMNYPAIFEGFAEMGIALDDIQPRENVFTYNAWLALGRQVRKGAHGVKVLTWIKAEGKDGNKDAAPTEANVESHAFRFARSTTVFHISQTDAVVVALAA
jgi:antirestriction protein ArdC